MISIRNHGSLGFCESTCAYVGNAVGVVVWCSAGHRGTTYLSSVATAPGRFQTWLCFDID